jgi:hypothetical protein
MAAFDPDTGQVFTQTSAPAPPSAKAAQAWVYSAPGSTKRLKGYQHADGADSLAEMAWRSLCIHSLSITPETFTGVPWLLALRLWKKLRKQYVYLFFFCSCSYLNPNQNVVI